MARYFSRTIILPDETHLDNLIVEVGTTGISYYPFVGEIHSTEYIDTPILISFRDDLAGKIISLSQLAWALHTESDDEALYVYRLVPCSSCAGKRFVANRL